jgi:hypothetical protein
LVGGKSNFPSFYWSFMKFRHNSNFIEIDLDKLILELITRYQSSAENLSIILACILLKEDVELTLERFGYVKIEPTN